MRRDGKKEERGGRQRERERRRKRVEYKIISNNMYSDKWEMVTLRRKLAFFFFSRDAYSSGYC